MRKLYGQDVLMTDIVAGRVPLPPEVRVIIAVTDVHGDGGCIGHELSAPHRRSLSALHGIY